jgi:enoyl-CoA hydratase
MAESVKVEQSGSVVVLTINREARRNALNDEALYALREALERAAARDDVAAVVLTGAGLKAFSAGSDIKELAEQSAAQRLAHTALGQDLADLMEELPLPVIAAIEGYCLGGGLEMALACDLRVAGEGAQLGLPEVQINALPTWGGTWRLPRLVGMARAKQVTLFGTRLTAQEALDWGLVAEVVPQGQATRRAVEIGETMAGVDRATIARAKALVAASFGAHGRVARQLEYLADSAQLTSAAFEEKVGGFGAR